jgi:glycosidase
MRWTADPERGGFTTGRPFRPLPPHGERHNAASQQADPGSLHAFYKSLIGLRNRHPALARGSYEAAEAQSLVATWQRRLGVDHVLVAINYGETMAALRVPQLAAGARLEPVLGHPTPAVAAEVPGSGGLVLQMPPQSLRVFTVRPPTASR